MDFLGNTSLHHAVGVYRKLNKFKPSLDVAEVVDSLVKHGADLNAQNHNGFTPLHVACSQQALEACLKHADDHSFMITDKRGRNFWHLLFLLRTEDELETALSMQLVTDISVGKFKVDDSGRTPLHYACKRTGGWTEYNEFINTLVNEPNIQDKFGRTALHYAATVGNQKLMELLKTKKADERIRDKFGRTAGEYMNMRHAFNMKVSLLRLTASLNVMARNDRRIPEQIVKQRFVERCNDFAPATEKIGRIIRELRGCDDALSYVRNIYLGRRFDYSDDRMTAEESAHQARTMFETIHSHVEKAMELLASEMSEYDSRFTCKVFNVGSAYEGTKIGCCDEFDYNFVLTDLSSKCKVFYSAESPPGYVLLKASSYNDEHLFNSNGTLNTRIVKFRFERLVKRVVSSLQFCDATGL